MVELKNQHRWSGWPGAYCMKCGSDDSMEVAIGLGYFDPFNNKWDSEEHREEYKDKECPVSDKQWYDHLVRTQGISNANIFFPDGIPI